MVKNVSNRVDYGRKCGVTREIDKVKTACSNSFNAFWDMVYAENRLSARL